MGPEEIILAETSNEAKESTVSAATAVKVQTPISISVEDFETIEQTRPCTQFEGRRVFGNTAGITDFSDIPIYYYCKCVAWDLTKAEDRIAYGDLISKTMSPASPYVLLWQERVIDGEKLILYLTYSEQIRIVGAVDRGKIRI